MPTCNEESLKLSLTRRVIYLLVFFLPKIWDRDLIQPGPLEVIVDILDIFYFLV